MVPSRLAGLAQALAWLAVWVFWVVRSRNNHPTLILKTLASALLTATFAGAVYANHLRLIPRFWNSGRYGAYGAALLLTLGVLALACAIAIHLVYDLLHGPDPARFGFGANVAMESALVAIHIAIVAGLVRWIGWFRREQPSA